MPKQNNIWDSSFNNPNLEDQDWLETGDDLFNSIEKQIYPKKKKRRGLVYWFLGSSLLIVFAIVAFAFYDFQKQDIKGLTDQSTQKIKDSITIQLNESLSGHIVNDKVADTVLENVESIQKRNVQENSKNNSVLEASSGQLENDNGITNISTDALSLDYTNEKDLFLEVNRLAREKFLKIKDAFPSNKKSTLVFGPNDSNFASMNRDLSIRLLSTSQIGLLEFQRTTDLELLPKGDFMRKDAKVSSHLIGLGFGMSFWNFNLNNNYETALNPADFSFENGRGLNGSIFYKNQISANWAFVTNAGMERIKFNSGHNSSVLYDTQNEMNGLDNNDISLLMATPLGFLNSDIVVSRNSSVSTNEVNLVLDLHNTHSITNLFIEGGFEYRIFESDLVNISGQTTLGINHLQSIRNELESFDIDNLQFESGETKITSSQESISKTTPFLGLSMGLSKDLKSNFQTELRFSSRSALRSIYKENDFSTRLNGLNINWSIAKKF